MASDNVTPIRPADPPDDGHSDLESRLLNEICSLRCVYQTIELAEPTNKDEDLGCAQNLLRRSISALGDLHEDLQMWHMGKRKAGGAS